MTAPARLGGMRLYGRGFGYHDAPGQWQRTIGAHVYIFQPMARGLTVWRLDLADADGGRGYRWTLVHEPSRWRDLAADQLVLDLDAAA